MKPRHALLFLVFLAGASTLSGCAKANGRDDVRPLTVTAVSDGQADPATLSGGTVKFKEEKTKDSDKVKIKKP